MSKRPTATGVLSRLRRPAGRLRDLPIWSKLGLIMIVPTLATIVVGTNGLIGHIETSNNADRARTLSNLSSDVGVLVHELQNERASGTLVLSNPAAAPLADAYRKQFVTTDTAQRTYALRRTGLADLPPSFSTLLRRIDSQLSELPKLREQIASRQDASLTHAMFFYRVLVADLLAIREASAQLAGETTLSDRMRSAAAVSNLKEFLAQERVVVLRALGEKELTPARVREFISTMAGQEQARLTFSAVGTPEEQSLLDQRVSGDDLRLAEKYEGRIESVLGGGRITDVGFDMNQWDTAQRERGNLLRKVEVELDNRMEAQATQLRDAVVRQVLVETGLLLGMLLLAILFAWLVARSMARSLRELRHGALAVAQYGLPQAVARLRDPALATQMSPAQLAHQIAEPLPVRSRDEFGQVTEAFNAVHMEAVRTAAEQASLRASVATMFVNLARRSQILVDRLIGHLDRLERGEEDPDALAELFQLDHLATRMRRNDENLLVLAGADSTRVQREPAALLDVLRAAQSEVEHYTRVEFGVIDRDIEVAAHAVNDLVHLVAELLDNATAFSPPDSAVIVEARRVSDRAVLLVEDRGIGVSAEQLDELNERLATPPLVDVTVSRMMGLVVVARLATRHGVKVELRPAPERGTIADVTLPTAVLVPRALTGRLAGAAGYAHLPPNRQQPAGGPPRPAFAAPLALESGPTTGPVPAEPVFRGFDARPVDADVDRGLLGAGSAGPGGGPGARGLPAWSDLTGVSGVNGTDPFAPRPAPASGAEPLPQRRPGDGRTVDGEVADRSGSTRPAHGDPDQSAPLIPRQIPLTPEARPNGYATGVPPVSAPPVPVSGPPAFAPPPPRPEHMPPPGPFPPGAATPPAWPPVGPSADAPPHVPGEFAAALDMTAEIPKLGPDGVPPVSAPPVPSAPPTSMAGGPYPTSMAGGPPPRSMAGGPPPVAGPVVAGPPVGGPRIAGPVAAGQPPRRTPDPRAARFADETMELPIFRELESAWFRTRRAVPDTTAPVAPAVAQPEPALAPAPSEEPAAVPVAAGAGTSAWQTAADDGWRAATAAADIPVTETTEAGLPKRVPMAQLVPGGVDKGASTTQRRTPEAVRGLLSAYHRGVQRGRTQPKDSNIPEPAGKEQEQDA